MTRNWKASTKARANGFTLIELIVVIAIIGILGAIVVPKLVPVMDDGKRAAAKHGVQKVVETAKMCYFMTGEWPRSLEDMIVRDGDPADGKPGFEFIPIDPWGQPYLYELRDGRPVAMTLGADQQEGGTGVNEDLVWPPRRTD